MSDENKSKKTLFAKAIFTEYGLGDHVQYKWSAKRLNEQRCEVTRANGTKVELSVGQDVPNCGIVSIDKNGNVNVGKYTVLVGENIEHDWRAKKTGKKNEYLFKKNGSRAIKASIGETIMGLGVIEGLDENGNVIVNNKTIPVETKIKEFKLLIYNEKHERVKSGNKCHFNVVIPGSEGNNENGIPGIFFQGKGSAPSKFCEIEADNTILCTATFWPAKDGRYVTGNIRTIDDARVEKALVEKIKSLEKYCEEIEIEKEDNFEWVEAKNLLKEINKKWESHIFSVITGDAAFGLKNDKEYSK